MSKEKFMEVYEEYLDKIYNFCFYRLGQNKELAEDIVSETFLRALESLDNYEERGYHFKVYLYRIANNLIIDQYREKKSVELPEELPDENAHLELAERVELSRIWDEIDKLPEEARTILTLRYSDGLPTAEIAEIVGKSEGNVRVIIHRLLKYLQKTYGRL